MVHVCAKKQQTLKAYCYFANRIIFVDRVVRVGYPPKRFKPHFWLSRPDCPLAQTSHSDTVIVLEYMYMYPKYMYSTWQSFTKQNLI